MTQESKMSKCRINISLDETNTKYSLYIIITFFITFGFIISTNNFLTSDALSYWMTGDWHSHCGSNMGFKDFFTGKWNCSFSMSSLGTGTTLLPFMLMSVITFGTYWFWFDAINEKYKLICIKLIDKKQPNGEATQ